MSVHTPAESPLESLPGLDQDEVQNDGTGDNAPLPGETEVLEDPSVQVWDVDDRECGQEATDHRPKQELVVVDSLEDRKRTGPARVHVEETAVEVLDFPRRDKEEETQG